MLINFKDILHVVQNHNHKLLYLFIKEINILDY